MFGVLYVFIPRHWMFRNASCAKHSNHDTVRLPLSRPSKYVICGSLESISNSYNGNKINKVYSSSRPSLYSGKYRGTQPSKHDKLKQCRFNVAQRLRRWPNIKTSLFQRVVFAGRTPFAGCNCFQSVLYSGFYRVALWLAIG